MTQKIMAILIGCLLVPSVSFAVSVRATVDRNRISYEDILNLTVTIEDADAEVDMSALKDFKILGHQTGSNFQWINGKSSRQYIHTYSLSPLDKGSLTIPPLTVNFKGKTYKTDAITVTVAREEQGADSDGRDIFVTARVNDGYPYTGQQIVYDFALYFSVQISNPSLSIPDFNDFVVKQTDKDRNYKRVINGREYNVIERQIVLVPLKAGTFTIPPSVLTCDQLVRSQGRSRDPFDSFFNNSPFGRSQRVRKNLKTEPVKIEVSPLPKNPYNVEFSGFVGKLKLSADMDRKALSVGDSATLTLTLEGVGNLMDVNTVNVTAPSGFKLYRDNPEEDIHIDSTGYRGKKVFSMALVPVKAGHVTIDPVKINYFDVEQGVYRILSTPSFDLSVQASETASGAAGEEPGYTDSGKPPVLTAKKKVEYTGHDILPLKDSLDSVKNRPGLSLVLFFALLLVPAGIAGIIKLVLVYSGRDESVGTRMGKRAYMALKQAVKAGTTDDEFLSCLYRSLISTVFSKARTQGETLTASELKSLLSDAGLATDRIDDAQSLLETLESVRFSGASLSPEKKKELLDKTRETLRRIR